MVIRFEDEAFEAAMAILNHASGIGIRGYNVGIGDKSYSIVGANQREDEDEIKLVVRELDEDYEPVGYEELRLSWDSELTVY